MKPAQPLKLLAIPLICLFLTGLQLKPIETKPHSFAAALGSAAVNPVPRAAPEETVKSSPNASGPSGEDLKRKADLEIAEARRENHSRPAVIPHSGLNLGAEVASDEFTRFTQEVADGETSIRGLYADGHFALKVIQQPPDNRVYVSGEEGIVTEFSSATDNGVTGLLAHNFLAGELFYSLHPGQEIRVVFGDGSYRRYRVFDSFQFQKLTPKSLRSDFIDLQTGEKISTDRVFNRFYTSEHHLTLQTCLKAEGISNWGLTFWIALPIGEEKPYFD